MTPSTRRAALGAILAAPLASVPAVAAVSNLADDEARFLAIGPRPVGLLDEYDRLWPTVHEPYEAWNRARDRFPVPHWPAAEALPEWHAYLAARRPADEVNEAIEALYKPFAELALTTLPAILLRVRYALTFDAFVEDVMDDLRELWRRQPPCV